MPAEDPLDEERLRRISRRLSVFELHRPDESGELSLEDLEADLMGSRSGGSGFLGFYSRRGLEKALEEYGIPGRLREMGFEPVLRIRREDGRSRLRITDGEGGPLLADLVCRFALLRPTDEGLPCRPDDPLDLVCVEWIEMRNPRASFTDERPALPGQVRPGLGLGRAVLTLLEIMAGRLGREGILAFPEHYHNAHLYHVRFRFASPRREAELRTLERDLADLSLAEASWAVECGLVRRVGAEEPHEWTGEEMVHALSERLERAFDDGAWEGAVERCAEGLAWDVDRKRLEGLMERVRRGEAPAT